MPLRLVAQLARRGDGGPHFLERGANGGVEALAGLGQPNAPSRPLYERDAQPHFEPADRLAHR
jgi:hypothetical protein